MSERIAITQVGAPDPEKRTSLIAQENSDEFALVGMEAPEVPYCHFNDTTYPEGEPVCSGDQLLVCRAGIWYPEGSCDPDNP